MIKTAKQIVGDIHDFLQGSELVGSISGGVYDNGLRPRDSQKEDIIITFTAGLSEQVQTGVVTLNIFVPDIVVGGVYVEDMERTSELETLAREWVEGIAENNPSNYLFSLAQTIFTIGENEINQHFVVVKLKYRYLDI